MDKHEIAEWRQRALKAEAALAEAKADARLHACAYVGTCDGAEGGRNLAQRKIRDLQARLAAAEKARDANIMAKMSWRNRFASLEQQLAACDEERAQGWAQANIFVAKHAAAEKDRDYYYADGWKAHDRIASLEASLAEAKAQLQDMIAISNENSRIAGDLQAKLAAADTGLKEAAGATWKWRQRDQDRRDRIASLEADKARLQASFDIMMATADARGAKLKELRMRLEGSEACYRNADATVFDLQAQLAAAKQEHEVDMLAYKTEREANEKYAEKLAAAEQDAKSVFHNACIENKANCDRIAKLEADRSELETQCELLLCAAETLEFELIRLRKKAK